MDTSGPMVTFVLPASAAAELIELVRTQPMNQVEDFVNNLRGQFKSSMELFGARQREAAGEQKLSPLPPLDGPAAQELERVAKGVVGGAA